MICCACGAAASLLDAVWDAHCEYQRHWSLSFEPLVGLV
jgi:hypothetical protein